MAEEAREKIKILQPKDASPLLSKWFKSKQEHFIAILLDGAHQVLKTVVVSKGLVNKTVVHPREVFAPAIVSRACAVILAHNHPSGRLDPSPEDIEITRRLCESGKILGIEVLDHLIFGVSGVQSMLEKGLMPLPGRD
jgi:DNA repair protein RadC